MDWYDTILKRRAKKLIGEAQDRGLGFVEFMKQASRSGLSEDSDIRNFASLLRENQLRSRGSEKQTEITGAVGAAMQPRPAMAESQLQTQRTSMSPEGYADQLAADPEVLRNAPAPKTEEEFMGAMGRQPLSPEIDTADVTANPSYQFAKGALGSSEDELGKARLKVQQDAEARKNKQISEQHDQAALRLRLQDRELAWKYYNAGVNAQKPEFENADNWDVKAEEAQKDFGEAEAKLNKWKTVAKEIDKEGSEYFGQYTPEEVNAQLASIETLMRNAKAQKEAWVKKASEIRKMAYDRGSKISKGSEEAFKEPKPTVTKPPASPAPATGGGITESVEQRRARLGY